MTDETYRSQFRLPYSLYESLKAEADKKHRSLNAEIVARLQESLDENRIYGHQVSAEITPEEIADLKSRVSAIEEASRAFLDRDSFADPDNSESR